jgi:hypothetical protein
VDGFKYSKLYEFKKIKATILTRQPVFYERR